MIKLYTSNWCSYCNAAKRFFEENNIKYKEINIEEKNISRQELLDLSGGYTVPQIFIHNQCIGGYDDLIKLHQNNKLMDLINE